MLLHEIWRLDRLAVARTHNTTVRLVKVSVKVAISRFSCPCHCDARKIEEKSVNGWLPSPSSMKASVSPEMYHKISISSLYS
jgi:hypothetical protein